MKKVEIVNLTKQEIKYTIKLHKTNRNSFKILLMSISFVFVLSLISNFYGFWRLSNPVNSLYNDNSSVIFTGGDVLQSPTFFIPIKGNAEVLLDGTINFVITNSIMIKAIENGIVEEVATSNDGYKYIKINHGKGWSSVISNLDIVGVTNSDIITRGKDIATGKVGQTVSLRIYFNNEQLNNLKIVGSKILCLD